MFLSKFLENIDDGFKITLLSLLINFKYDNASAIFHYLEAIFGRSVLLRWKKLSSWNDYFSSVKGELTVSWLIQIQKHKNHCNVVCGMTMHKKWSFPLRIFLVNVNKSAFSCRIVHICLKRIFIENFIFSAVWILEYKCKSCV